MNKGVTLVEMVIAVAISALIGGLLLVIIVNSVGVFYKESSKLQTGLNINDTLFKVRSSIKEASSVDSTSTSTQLVLKVSSIDDSGDIIQNTFDYYIFLKDQNFLHFKILPDSVSKRASSDQILTNLVEQLTFKYFDLENPPNEVLPQVAKTVSISLALKQKSGSGYEINTQNTEANLRND